jgi:hypothetical protein
VTASRARTRLGAIVATALITLALMPGLASAADTRLLSLTMSTPTRVSVPASGKGPYATMFKVDATNTGGQNLAHTVLTINANATNNSKLALATIYDPDGGSDAGFCAISGDVITCDYSSLGAGASRTVAVVVAVSSNYVAGTGPLFTASATTNNENGSNTQTFPKDSGTFAVEAEGTNTLSTFVLDGVVGENLATSDVAASNKLNTNITFNNGTKQLVQINEGTSTAAVYPCPAGLTCQADYSEVLTDTGSFTTSPFFTWKLTAIVAKTYSLSQGFIAHFDESDKTTTDWILYFKDKSAQCGTNIDAKIASAGQCIKTLSLTKFDKTNNLLVVEVVMDHQGGLKY